MRGLNIAFKLAFRSVFNNWAKNKVIISIVAVSFLLIQVLLSVAIGFGGQVKNFALYSLVGHIKIMHSQYKIDNSLKNNFFLPDETIDKIASIKDVKGATKRIQVPVVFKSEREIKNASIIGLDLSREKDLSFIGKAYDYNKFPVIFENSGILIGEKLLNKLKTQKLHKIVASGQNASEKLIETPYFVKDTFKSTLPNVEEVYVFTNIEDVAKVYSLGNNITEVSVVLDDDKNIDKITEEIRNIVPKDLVVYQWGELMPFLKRWLDMMLINMAIFFGIVFFAASIPLANTLLISVLERVHEFGIMQALGLKKSYLAIFIIAEGVIILAIGISIGMLLGLIISYILHFTGINISAFAKGAGGIGLGDYIYPKVSIIYTIYIALLMLFLGFLSSIYPAIKASLYNPVQALSKRG